MFQTFLLDEQAIEQYFFNCSIIDFSFQSAFNPINNVDLLMEV